MYEATADKSVARRLALDYSEVPPVFEWIWREFCAIPRSGGGGFDRARLTVHDIEAWERRIDYRFSLYETEFLIELDGVEPKNALGEGDD